MTNPKSLPDAVERVRRVVAAMPTHVLHFALRSAYGKRGAQSQFATDLTALLSQLDKLETENAKFRELDNEDWFTEIAEFLDDYTDAEIIDGTTHPNTAMRLLCKLQELGL